MILIEILTAPGCTYCEVAKQRIASFVQKVRDDLPDIIVKVIDIVDHPEIRFKYDVLSTPAIAINGRVQFIGVPRDEDLEKQIMEVIGRT